MPGHKNALRYKDLTVAPGSDLYEILTTPALKHRAEPHYKALKQAEIDLIKHYDDRDKQ